jgi:hypothetical protein
VDSRFRGNDGVGQASKSGHVTPAKAKVVGCHCPFLHPNSKRFRVPVLRWHSHSWLCGDGDDFTDGA